MIDLKNYRENPEIYKKGAEDKLVKVDFNLFNKLDEQVRNLKQQLDDLNALRNSASKEIETKKRNGEDASDAINQVKEIKEKIENIQSQYNASFEKFNEIYISIPNPSAPEVPFGKSDEENQEIEFVGEKTKFDFKPLPHWELLEQRDLLDQKRSAKVSGARFYYIRDGLVRLELALISRLMEKLTNKGFRATMGPNLVREEAMVATGFFPADKNEIYTVNPGEDNLYLIGTSEVSMVAQHMDEILDVNQLPLRYVAFSPCYRREAGSYGKDTRGMIRVHQFEKVEMVSFVKPEDSYQEHDFLLSIEEEIYKDLGIPYSKLLICTGDLGAPASKKYDLEAWFPGQECVKEITSTSNCTDFQARRGRIKYKNGDKKEFVHTLNGTAASMRALVAIVENYQTKDLRIKVPQVLRKYLDEEFI